MAQIVAAGALSHSPIINAEITPTDEEARRIENFRNGARELGRRVSAARPDALIIFGPDHFRGFFYDLMPPFCIGTGRVRGWGDWGTTEHELPGNAEFARHLHREVLEAGFDLACSYDLRVDHGITQAVPLLEMPEQDVGIPIVPIFVNCAAPPLPVPARCFELGKAVGRAVASWQEIDRVAILASGGLSHTVPSVSVESTLESDRPKIEKLINGKAFVQSDAKSREAGLLETIPQFATGINSEWDEMVLDRLGRGEFHGLAEMLSEPGFADKGGNGGAEIRTWLAMAGAVSEKKFETLAYEPIPILITGMSVIAAEV